MYLRNDMEEWSMTFTYTHTTPQHTYTLPEDSGSGRSLETQTWPDVAHHVVSSWEKIWRSIKKKPKKTCRGQRWKRLGGGKRGGNVWGIRRWLTLQSSSRGWEMRVPMPLCLNHLKAGAGMDAGCNVSIQEPETGGRQVQTHPSLPREPLASHSYTEIEPGMVTRTCHPSFSHPILRKLRQRMRGLRLSLKVIAGWIVN